MKDHKNRNGNGNLNYSQIASTIARTLRDLKLKTVFRLHAFFCIVLGLFLSLLPRQLFGALTKAADSEYDHMSHEYIRLYGVLNVAIGWLIWKLREITDGRIGQAIAESFAICYLLQFGVMLRAQFRHVFLSHHDAVSSTGGLPNLLHNTVIQTDTLWYIGLSLSFSVLSLMRTFIFVSSRKLNISSCRVHIIIEQKILYRQALMRQFAWWQCPQFTAKDIFTSIEVYSQTCVRVSGHWLAGRAGEIFGCRMETANRIETLWIQLKKTLFKLVEFPWLYPESIHSA